jgi:hypothetical protein
MLVVWSMVFENEAQQETRENIRMEILRVETEDRKKDTTTAESG